MSKLLTISIVLIVLSAVFAKATFAKSPPSAPKEEYFKAKILQIVDSGKIISNGQTNLYQDLKVEIQSGTERGKIINLHYGDPNTLTKEQEVSPGDNVVLLKTSDNSRKPIYSIYDRYRFNNIILLIAFFVLLVIIIAGLKGLGSFIGLLVSLSVILFFIVPMVLKGFDPLLISIIGALVILFITTYIAHGISKQTTVALASTFIALFITSLLSTLASNFANITGVGNEDIATLQFGVTNIINLKGLFLGGVIIGTLGALNDVTITQSATVFELAKTHTSNDLFGLLKRSFLIGREHILSMVNTLVLAYAGSSLFIFIFLVLNPAKVPYWVIFNSETISDEVISAVVGSSGLILAVPIVTLIASYVALNWKTNAHEK